MATILPADVSGIELSRVFRSPRCYAPELVTAMLANVVGSPGLGILIDVDALERSALARFDGVMRLALSSLADADTTVLLVARRERERGLMVSRTIPRCAILHDAGPLLERARAITYGAPIIAIGDDPALFAQLGDHDRGLALGRPELAADNIVALGDVSVRATLWWLYEQRTRALAA